MTTLRRLVLPVAALAVVLLSGACSPEEETAFRSVNTLRNAHELRWLDWNESAHQKARAWSAHMAAEGQLSHSELAEGMEPGWRRLGENVAVASSVEEAMATLEASPPHRANLLHREFLSVGIGVVEKDGRVWVTQVFVG